MNTTKQDWLINYLINNGFSVKNTLELQEKINGMTASQIIDAMEIAKTIRENLDSTPLGRELT